MLLALLPLLIASHLALVRLLRYRRLRALEQRYAPSLSRMTPAEAQSILQTLGTLEFPQSFSASLFFALFKTYAIPSISSLLSCTGQLHGENASKRAADTGILMLEVLMNPWGSARSVSAIARMNYLHKGYRNGRIREADMLYTLSLFALDCGTWIEGGEWRGMSCVERCAFGVFYGALGEAMGIKYVELRLGGERRGEGRKGWRDGVEWMDDLEMWSAEFEKSNLKEAKSNRVLAEATLGILMENFPAWVGRWLRGFFSTLIREDVRRAMLLPLPSRTWRLILKCWVHVRRFYIRYLAYPRLRFQRVKWINPHPNPRSGKFNSVHWNGYPWYAEGSWSNRWDLDAWVTWALGGVLPGDLAKFRPEGYRIEEVGPVRMEGWGGGFMEREKERLKGGRRERPFY